MRTAIYFIMDILLKPYSMVKVILLAVGIFNSIQACTSLFSDSEMALVGTCSFAVLYLLSSLRGNLTLPDTNEANV